MIGRSARFRDTEKAMQRQWINRMGGVRKGKLAGSIRLWRRSCDLQVVGSGCEVCCWGGARLDDGPQSGRLGE